MKRGGLDVRERAQPGQVRHDPQPHLEVQPPRESTSSIGYPVTDALDQPLLVVWHLELAEHRTQAGL